jgi:hypothetical protein
MSVATSVLNPRNLAITVPIYLVAGFIFGLACWFYGEHLYRKGAAEAP